MSSVLRWICFAIWWPCAGPKTSVRRINMSSVPCNSSIRSSDSFAIGAGRYSTQKSPQEGRRTTQHSVSSPWQHSRYSVRFRAATVGSGHYHGPLWNRFAIETPLCLLRHIFHGITRQRRKYLAVGRGICSHALPHQRIFVSRKFSQNRKRSAGVVCQAVSDVLVLRARQSFQQIHGSIGVARQAPLNQVLIALAATPPQDYLRSTLVRAYVRQHVVIRGFRQNRQSLDRTVRIAQDLAHHRQFIGVEHINPVVPLAVQSRIGIARKIEQNRGWRFDIGGYRRQDEVIFRSQVLGRSGGEQLRIVSVLVTVKILTPESLPR